MNIQTFDDYAKWHPHIHTIVDDGLFCRSGVFYVMSKIRVFPLTEMFRANVLSMQKEEGLSDEVLPP